MDILDVIHDKRISIQVGRDTLSPHAFSVPRVLELVEDYNESIRLPTLAENLNAEHLSEEKVRAFLDGLPQLDKDELSLLAGQTIRLNLPDLHLHTFSAVTAAALRSWYRLSPAPNNANPHLAGVMLRASISSKLALETIADACRAITVCDRELERLAQAESTREYLAASAGIRHKRRSAAMVWLALAQQLNALEPVPPNAASLVEAARDALSRHSVAPSAGGMPP